MNTLPKVVFSRTLSSVSWSNARLARRPVEEDLPTLKAQGDLDMVCFGGARFAHALAARRLIDEYRLTVHPVALGAGLPLWHGLSEPQRLRLVSSTVYADGSVTQTLLPDAQSTGHPGLSHPITTPSRPGCRRSSNGTPLSTRHACERPLGLLPALPGTRSERLEAVSTCARLDERHHAPSAATAARVLRLDEAAVCADGGQPA